MYSPYALFIHVPLIFYIWKIGRGRRLARRPRDNLPTRSCGISKIWSIFILLDVRLRCLTVVSYLSRFFNFPTILCILPDWGGVLHLVRRLSAGAICTWEVKLIIRFDRKDLSGLKSPNRNGTSSTS